jgi:hypothetical protein
LATNARAKATRSRGGTTDAASTGWHKAFDLHHLPNAQQAIQGCDQGLTQIGLDQPQQLVLALKMELRQARVRQYSW